MMCKYILDLLAEDVMLLPNRCL